MSHIQIAIDGPSGAGKSSLSKAVAKALGIMYVDTGALYRTVGYYACSLGLPADKKGVAPIADHLGEISLEVKYEEGEQCVYLNGERMGDRIRSSDMSMYASAVSAVPAVRIFLLDVQKDIAMQHSVIMDGRDIGTVILPEADVKIFLTASPEARARRRTRELAEKGIPDTYEQVLADMLRRDEQDRSREIAPAIAAPDALHFDNSYDGFEEAFEMLLTLIREELTKKGKGDTV